MWELWMILEVLVSTVVHFITPVHVAKWIMMSQIEMKRKFVKNLGSYNWFELEE